tara:strand:- start:166465 stop:166722 length:258 start_codon:yes stop_codon:yes gene_type:complete
MNNFEMVTDLIQESISGAKVKVSDLTGTQDHLGILVVSEIFEGKSLIEQHQLIMDILKEKLKEEIHAVQIKTLTPEKAKNRGIEI